MDAEYVKTFSYIVSLPIFLLNFLFIYVLRYRTTRIQGRYRLLLILNSIFNLTHFSCDLMGVVNVYTYKQAFAVYLVGFMSYWDIAQYFTLAVAFFLVTLQIAFSAFHFMFRYAVICRPRYRFLMFDQYFFSWLTFGHVLSFCILISIMWTLTSDEEECKFLEKELQEVRNISLPCGYFISAMYHVENADGSISYRWKNILGIWFNILLLIVGYLIIVVALIFILKFVYSAAISENLRKHEMRLLKMLIAQTTVPTIFLYFTFLILVSAPAIGISLGSNGNWIILCWMTFPLLEPVVNMCFMPEVTRFLRRKKDLSAMRTTQVKPSNATSQGY